MSGAATGIAVRNVLLATDFSEESAQAIPYVRSLCRAYQARVHVAHVVDVFPYSLSDTPEAVKKRTDLLSSGEARLRDFTSEYHLDPTHFESVILSGEVFAAIEKFAVESAIDLIVLGSRGDAGLKRLFDGSVSEEIFRTAHCPVLIVGPEAREPSEAGLFNSIVYATDMSASSTSALPYLEFLLESNPNARLTIAHFVTHGAASPYDLHLTRRRIENELRGLLPAKLRHRVTDVFVEEAPPAAGMVELAARMRADLLVLGVRYAGAFFRAATHGLCSLAYEIIGKANCPVLTVRSAEEAPGE